MDYTEKEAAFIKSKLSGASNTAAAIQAGYSKRSAHITGNQLIKKPHIRRALFLTLEDFGINLEAALKPIQDALTANKVISAVSAGDANGATTDFIDVPDHPTRLKAAGMTLDLLGMKHGAKPTSLPETPQMSPELLAAMKSGNEVELQRAVWRKVDPKD